MFKLLWTILIAAVLPPMIKAGHNHGCKPPPCRNGGTCKEAGDSYSCTCTAGWKGIICDKPNCSYPGYCINGQCHEDGSSYSCTCNDGWKGSNCELIDCSYTGYCINGGQCDDHGSTYSCTCYHGWKGSNCELIDECTPHVKADVVFVLDRSYSQDDSIFQRQKYFAKNFASKFRVGPLNYRYQFALITYAFNATVHFHLDAYQDDTDLQTAIDNVKDNENGPTMTGNALKVVHEQILPTTRNDAEFYVLLMTDGLSTDKLETQSQAGLLRNNSVRLMAVAGGNSISHVELLDITGSPGRVFPMYNTDALYAVLQNSMDGCIDCGTRASDVAIVMDVSGHLRPQELETEMKAAEFLMSQIGQVGPTGLQFSLTKFSDSYTSIFDFKTYTEMSDMVVAMNINVQSDTSTQYASFANVLEHVKSDVFLSSNGNRPSFRNILVVISSGKFENGDDFYQKLSDIKAIPNTVIVTIGPGGHSNETALTGIASDPALSYIIGDDVYTDVTVLSSLLTTFQYELCSNI